MPLTAERRLMLRERMHLLDYAILSLALASVIVFITDRTGDLAGREIRVLTWIDLGLVGLYGIIFLAKGLLAHEPARWFRRHAWLAFGLMPLTIPLLIAEPWFILVQVLILLLRAGKALDRAFDAHILSGMTERYKSMLAEEIAEPLLMRLAVVLEESVTSRDYAAAIGNKLDERRDLVEAAVKRGIEASPKLSRVARFGPVQRLVDDTTREVVDAAHAALTGPEINTIIREAWTEAFAELKDGIRERKWQRKGYGLFEVADGVLHPRRVQVPVIHAPAAGAVAMVTPKGK